MPGSIVSSASTCIRKAGNSDTEMLDTEKNNTIRNAKNEDVNSNKVIHCKVPENCNEQFNWHNAVNSLHKISNTEWNAEMMILDEYFVYWEKLTSMLLQLESR